jgi:hypothetical protein
VSNYYAKVTGKIYGPFTREQLNQMASSGRINSETEVSADRVAWTTAGGLLRLPAGPDAGTRGTLVDAAPASPIQRASGDSTGYLQLLRNHSRYPFYRTSVMVATVVGYMFAAAPIVVSLGRIAWLGLSSLEVYEPVASAVLSGLLAILVTVLREVASMFADLVDSTLDHHARLKG